MNNPRPYELWSFQSAWNWAVRWDSPQTYPYADALLVEFWGHDYNPAHPTEPMGEVYLFLKHRLGRRDEDPALDYFMAMATWEATRAA